MFQLFNVEYRRKEIGVSSKENTFCSRSSMFNKFNVEYRRKENTFCSRSSMFQLFNVEYRRKEIGVRG